MSEPKKTIRTDLAVIIGASCLVGGFLLGLLSYHLIGGGPSMAQAPMAMPPPGSSAPPPVAAPPSAPMANYSEEIRELKKIIETQPDNRAVLVKLGNLYFDSGMQRESIDAYTKALDIMPYDANVLTDRGIMYRQLQNFDQALADFAKAAEVDPAHTQSLFNMGVVKLHDLQDYNGAIQAWESLLQRNPPPQMANQINQQLAQLRQMAAGSQ